MIEVTVRLFATLRHQAGWSVQTVTVPEHATVRDLLTQLDDLLPGLDVSTRTLYAAVNQTYARPEQVLQSGDEVAFFPPVSGGCDAWAHGTCPGVVAWTLGQKLERAT